MPIEPEIVVHCYFSQVPEHGSSAHADCAAALDEAGRERTARMVARRQTEFAAGRWLLRRAAGCHAPGRAEVELGPLEENGNALPRLPDLDAAGFHYSLSHSHGLVAVAIARDCAVGIDVEQARDPRDLAALIDEIAAPDERDWLAAAPDHAERLRRFYCCWTRKESQLKMHLRGIGDEPLQGLSARAGWAPEEGGESAAGFGLTWQRGEFAAAIAAERPFSVAAAILLPGAPGLAPEEAPPGEFWTLVRRPSQPARDRHA